MPMRRNETMNAIETSSVVYLLVCAGDSVRVVLFVVVLVIVAGAAINISAMEAIMAGARSLREATLTLPPWCWISDHTPTD